MQPRNPGKSDPKPITEIDSRVQPMQLLKTQRHGVQISCFHCALCNSVFQNYFRALNATTESWQSVPSPSQRLIPSLSRCNFLNTEARRTRRTILLLLCALCNSVFQNYFGPWMQQRRPGKSARVLFLCALCDSVFQNFSSAEQVTKNFPDKGHQSLIDTTSPPDFDARDWNTVWSIVFATK